MNISDIWKKNLLETQTQNMCTAPVDVWDATQQPEVESCSDSHFEYDSWRLRNPVAVSPIWLLLGQNPKKINGLLWWLGPGHWGQACASFGQNFPALKNKFDSAFFAIGAFFYIWFPLEHETGRTFLLEAFPLGGKKQSHPHWSIQKVHIYVCVYICIYICIYAYVYMHICICLRAYMYMSTCIYVYICMALIHHAYMHISMWVYAYIYLHRRIYVHVYMHVSRCIHLCVLQIVIRTHVLLFP